jgi:hypothetical protein
MTFAPYVPEDYSLGASEQEGPDYVLHRKRIKDWER